VRWLISFNVFSHIENFSLVPPRLWKLRRARSTPADKEEIFIIKQKVEREMMRWKRNWKALCKNGSERRKFRFFSARQPASEGAARVFMVQQTRKFYAVGFLFISPLLPKFLHDNGFFLQQGVIKWVIWVNKREKRARGLFYIAQILGGSARFIAAGVAQTQKPTMRKSRETAKVSHKKRI
jgi:hypothetical protein